MAENAKTAISKLGGFHVVEKVEDIVKLWIIGVMSTPALVVDGCCKKY